MRVLLTLPSLAAQFGGPTGKASRLAGALRRLGQEVTVIGAGRTAEEGTLGLATVGRFHSTPIPLSPHRIVSAVRSVHVVHVIGYRDPVGTVAALGAAAHRIPYLVEPVGMRRRRVRSNLLKAAFDATLGQLVMRRAGFIVATSSREAVELHEDGVSPSHIAVRANGLDLESLRSLPPRGSLRLRLGLDGRAPLVLAVARLVRTKGLPFLIDSVARLAGVHLVVAGPDERDGTLEAVMKARASLGLSGRVHVLHAGLWGTEKLQALADADVFCLVSMTENFGLAAAEAAACGTATIVSDQCGVAEWLGDGVAVVPYGDVPRLSTTIERLLRDPVKRRALAERGRVAARALSWEAIAKQQVALYERALHPT